MEWLNEDGSVYECKMNLRVLDKKIKRMEKATAMFVEDESGRVCKKRGEHSFIKGL